MRSERWRLHGCVVGLALSLAACGRHEVEVGVLSDASAEDMTTPFGEPVLVEGLLDPTKDLSDPSLSQDMLELFFTSKANGTYDIWTSTRSDMSEPWAPAVVVDELSDESYESEPSLSSDGLTLWFSSNRPGAPMVPRIWVTHRPSRSEPWGVPEIMDWGTSDNDRGPSVDATDLHIVFYSKRTTSGDEADLYLASRSAKTADFGQPSALSEINSPATDWDPGLFGDGLGLLFGSTREAQGWPDLYETARPSEDAPFIEPVPRAELNSTQAEGDPWLSNDGRYIIFASARDGASQLYEASR